MRKALTLPPTYGRLASKQDAYLHPLELRKLARESGRYWLFHSQPTTVALEGQRYAKNLSAFTSHDTETAFRELLREYASYGVPRPSGYADVFHERYRSPRVNWSVNARLAPAFAGGWQEALKIGAHHGLYRKYDLNSAYLWAATLGMPNVKSYKRSLRPWTNGRDGLYRVKLLRPTKGVPFPFNQATEAIATNEEIEAYSLPIAKVVEGVTWEGLDSPDVMLDAIKVVSTWKQAGRSYWGRWAQMQRLECVSKEKRWPLSNPCLNIPWAHLIVARVRMKLWEVSTNAVHVFVDSVITSDTLPVTSLIGGWRLEKAYPYGVYVRGPGQYGGLEQDRLERMAGVSPTSPLRRLPISLAI